MYASVWDEKKENPNSGLNSNLFNPYVRY